MSTQTITRSIGDDIAADFSANKHHLSDAEQRRLAGMIDAKLSALEEANKKLNSEIASTKARYTQRGRYETEQERAYFNLFIGELENILDAALSPSATPGTSEQAKGGEQC